MAVVAFLVGWIGLIGWALDIDALTHILPGLVALRANTSIGFILAGASLWLVQGGSRAGLERRAAQLCAVLVVLLGLVNLGESLLGWRFGIDRFLFPDVSVSPLSSGRMSVTVAASFFFIGLALLLLSLRRADTLRVAQVLGLLTVAPSLVALAGYAYSVEVFYAHPISAIAVHAALAFLALCAGILLAYPEKGLMAITTASTAGGYMLRRMAPAVILVPLALGWLVYVGRQAGFYNAVVELSMLAVSSIVVFTVLVFLSAWSLHRMDINRRRAEFRKEYMEEYISLVSHDLRAPLTVIQGQAQLLQSRLTKAGLDRGVVRGADAIEVAAHRMNAMIQDMVDSARLEAGHLELQRQPIDLRSFVADLLERNAQAMDVARMKAGFPPDLPPVDADPNRLERVLINLLSNALKYSEAGTQVDVRTRVANGMVVVSVSDRGQGISAEELPHVFERFFRSRDARRHDGLGLGLYITRMLVEAHGGRIWVESQPRNGSTFSFSLPVSSNSSKVAPRESGVAVLPFGQLDGQDLG